MLNVCNLHSGLMDGVDLSGNKLFESFNAGKYGIDSIAKYYEANWDGGYYSKRYPTADGVSSFRFDACDNGADTPLFCKAEYALDSSSGNWLFQVDTFIIYVIRQCSHVNISIISI